VDILQTEHLEVFGQTLYVEANVALGSEGDLAAAACQERSKALQI